MSRERDGDDAVADMRYALISDIHANLPALESVLKDIAMRGDADAVYHAIASALAAASAAPRVTRIAISVSGSRSVTARITHNGRHRNAELAAAALLARHAWLGFKVERQRQKTGQGTIVTIQYAGRRSAGG